jgi:hypothetical protein
MARRVNTIYLWHIPCIKSAKETLFVSLSTLSS